MSLSDTMAATSAAAVLAGSGVAKMKPFSFDGFLFSPVYLAGLADEIRYDYLHVKKDIKADGSSGYDAWTNTIYLNFTCAQNQEQRGMIVHEATHAMFDFQGKPMDVATSESLAYTAQCLFARANSAFPDDPDQRLGKWDEDGNELVNDGVFKVGYELAGKILAGTPLSSDDFANMRAAVARHPFYLKTYKSKANYNGY